MTRLMVHVEGETEEVFVNELLQAHLIDKGYTVVSARLLGNARQRARRGGIKAWEPVKRDIIRHLREDRHSIATTMVDYYALPQSEDNGWPGRREAVTLENDKKGQHVQAAILRDLTADMGPDFDQSRFIPFVVMHEFEGLLFSDCERFAHGIGRLNLAPQLQEIRDAFENPESINDSPQTAPSKRISALIPEYQKPLYGGLAALSVGLERIRDQCPHFNDWLHQLESIK
jgi:hypothetical protein